MEQFARTLPCGHPLHNAHFPFNLPCGQPLHTAHRALSLPCGHAAQIEQSHLTLPWEQGWHCTQYLCAFPCLHGEQIMQCRFTLSWMQRFAFASMRSPRLASFAIRNEFAFEAGATRKRTRAPKDGQPQHKCIADSPNSGASSTKFRRPWPIPHQARTISDEIDHFQSDFDVSGEFTQFNSEFGQRADSNFPQMRRGVNSNMSLGGRSKGADGSNR